MMTDGVGAAIGGDGLKVMDIAEVLIEGQTTRRHKGFGP